MSNRNRRGFDVNRCYFVTTTFIHWRHLFLDDSYYTIAAESLNFCCTKYNARIISFVFMPSHVHFILHFIEEPRCSDFMRDWKKYVSITFRTMIGEAGLVDLLDKLRYEKGRQQFRVWRSRFYASTIHNEKSIRRVMRYIHRNPVKAGLVGIAIDYRWCSARWYVDQTQDTVVKLKHFRDL